MIQHLKFKFLLIGTNISGEIFGPLGGSKNVMRGPFISIKFVPRGPDFL